ncbi:hypothetical protein [Mucilaginibacter sp.]|uniref:hypothetical protein n=1 Tax=Mucilaginibacter sp. TaxID=1882438 RepID=UPI002608043E|nr:hypothetical protein [Mucilaginibacter sp.]
MENKEWLDDYLSLKQVSTTNSFTVPDGYFDGLKERIISGIKLDEIKNTTPLDGFTIPENYFEDLSSTIKSKINIETILNPENTGFTVPANYFEELKGKIQNRLLIEKAVNNAEDTFTVPLNYFSQLNKNILNKTVNRDVVKSKSAMIRMISSTAFKYATAACVILMLGTGIFFRMQSPTAIHDRSFLHKELSVVPVNEIQSYLDENVDANETQHTVTDENLPVNAADLKAALQDYTDNNQ